MTQERTARGIVRRSDDRVVAGVCSGLADHFGTDPLLVRIGFVVLALLGLGGVVVYLAAWILIPSDDSAGGTRRDPLSLALLLVVAAIVAAPALAGILSSGFPLLPDSGLLHREPLVIAAVLVGVGLLLLRGRGGTNGGTPEVPGSGAGSAPGAVEGVAGLPRYLRPRPARRPRERSALTPLTLALTLLLVGVAGGLANAGRLGLDVGQLAALSLLVVGLGLVLGAWWGRARLLIPLGILMTPVVLVASLADFPPTGSIGSPYLMPRRAGDLENLRILVGQATLDLSEYGFEEGTEHLRLRVAAGSITVIVPHDLRVDADVAVEGGEAFVFGGHRSGFGIAVQDSAGREGFEKKLRLDIKAGFGSVGIYRLNRPRPDPQTTRDGGRGERAGNDGPARARNTRQEGRSRQGRDRRKERDR